MSFGVNTCELLLLKEQYCSIGSLIREQALKKLLYVAKKKVKN